MQSWFQDNTGCNDLGTTGIDFTYPYYPYYPDTCPNYYFTTTYTPAPEDKKKKIKGAKEGVVIEFEDGSFAVIEKDSETYKTLKKLFK